MRNKKKEKAGVFSYEMTKKTNMAMLQGRNAALINSLFTMY